MSFSNYLENKILDFLFDKASYSPPTIHIALSTANPGEGGGGMAEPSGNGYARIATAPASWNAASAGATSNASILSTPESTGAWGNITHFALFDASSGGNMLGYGGLQIARNVNAAGIILRFNAGDLVCTLD